MHEEVDELKKISVIIPIYNAECFLKRMLESIVKQTIFNQLEVILVNDGSIDNSLEICKHYEKTYNNIKLYSKINGGVSSARNFGLDRATGEYVCFFDADDEVECLMYETLLNLIEKNNSDMAIVDYIRVFPNGEKIKKRNKMKKEICGNNEIYKIFFKGGMIGNNLSDKILKRELIEKNKIRFLENMKIGEDMYYIFQYLNEVNKISIDFNYEGMYYYVNFGSAMNRQFTTRFFDTIRLSELMLEKIDKDSELYDYAEAHLVHEICKVCEYILLHDNERIYVEEQKELKKKIKKYSIFKAYKFLSKRQFCRTNINEIF